MILISGPCFLLLEVEIYRVFKKKKVEIYKDGWRLRSSLDCFIFFFKAKQQPLYFYLDLNDKCFAFWYKSVLL